VILSKHVIKTGDVSACRYNREAAIYNAMNFQFLIEYTFYGYGCRELRPEHTVISGSLETNYCVSLTNLQIRNDWRKR
jgi:hypothetical protein